MKVITILGMIVTLFAVFALTSARSPQQSRDSGKYTKGIAKNPKDTGRLVLPKEPRYPQDTGRYPKDTGRYPKLTQPKEKPQTPSRLRPTRASSLPRYPPTQYPVTPTKGGRQY